MSLDTKYLSAQGGVAVTKSDTTRFPACRGLYVGGTGDVNVVWPNGTTLVIPSVPAGMILPVSIIGVMSASTTATLMVALS